MGEVRRGQGLVDRCGVVSVKPVYNRVEWMGWEGDTVQGGSTASLYAIRGAFPLAHHLTGDNRVQIASGSG